MAQERKLRNPNSIAKTHAETSLLWFDYRTAERRERGVEGKEVE